MFFNWPKFECSNFETERISKYTKLCKKRQKVQKSYVNISRKIYISLLGVKIFHYNAKKIILKNKSKKNQKKNRKNGGRRVNRPWSRRNLYIFLFYFFCIFCRICSSGKTFLNYFFDFFLIFRKKWVELVVYPVSSRSNNYRDFQILCHFTRVNHNSVII